jgi:hypothetical protein
MKSRCSGARRKGVATLLALAVLTVLVVVGVTLATQGFMELRKSDSLTQAAQARLAAESGVAYMSHVVREIRLSNNVNETTFMTEFQAALGQLMAPMASSGVVVAKVGQTVRVSEIQLPRGSFSCEFVMDASATPPSARMTVTGRAGEIVRRAAVTYACVGKRSTIFDFGVASRGKIVISGSALLKGKNNSQEASVLSTRSEPVGIQAGGHATITGDLYVTGKDVDFVVLQGGSLSIGGSTDIAQIYSEHVYLGTQEPDFPEINTAQFIPLATHVIDSPNPAPPFNNIRVKAGTNPTFPANCVINGVMYVEAPNKVKFAGQSTIKGMIVTQDASGQDIDKCQIEFVGGTSAPGVVALPDGDPQFAAIKKQVGTVLLAPGFGVTFKGASNSVNGLIAADQLTFSGSNNISGDITGSIIGLKDYELNLQGNAEITISRPDASMLPAGFKHPFGLEPQAGSYSEPVP